MAGDIRVRASSRFSFKRITVCGIVLAVASLLIVLLGAAFMTLDSMKAEADVSLDSAKRQIDLRIEDSFKLLESLADQPVLYDPSVPVMDKVDLLDGVNAHYGYFLLCYVDADINVWDATGPASLASRDFMQKLYATGERLVTDSFAAGADGVTLNYVVLVPLFDERGTMTGSLFVSLYFDEVVDVLNASLADPSIESVLIGSRGQVMSAVGSYEYDDPYLDPLRSSVVFGPTADQVESELLDLHPVGFWTIEGFDLRYHAAAPVENTSWDVVCVSSFWDVYGRLMSTYAPIAASLLVAIVLAFLVTRRIFSRQMESARLLEKSVEELQEQVYSGEHPADGDIADILELTSTGLTDGLTGVVTRSVFMSKLPAALEAQERADSLSALCFVDLDDLKMVNDTYGHAAGDIALKSIGYVLREFEYRYDGLSGRYGGDEFVVLLTGIDDEAELCGILDEMLERLRIDIREKGGSFTTKCSVGVSLWDRAAQAESLIAQADKALYLVKRRGKDGYLVYQDEEWT